MIRATTVSLLDSFGRTSARMVFISMSLFGFLAKCFSLVSEAFLAALVRGVVLRKNAALVLPTLTGEPGSMMRPGLFCMSRAAVLKLLSMIKQSSELVEAAPVAREAGDCGADEVHTTGRWGARGAPEGVRSWPA